MSRPRILSMTLAILLASVQLAAQVPDIMYQRYNEGSGTSSVDLAIPGVGANPSLPAGCGWNQPQAILGGSCLDPGGTSGAPLDTGATVNLTGDWTIEFWCVSTFTTASFPVHRKFVFSDNTVGSLNGGMTAYTSGILMNNFDFTFEPSASTSITFFGGLPLLTWTHFAFTYDSTTKTLTAYRNGIFYSSTVYVVAIPLKCSPGTNLAVGGNTSALGTWIGNIDELRIWSSCRTATEISTYYNVEIPSFSDNLKVDAITSPNPPLGICDFASSSEVVSLSVTNSGYATIPAGTLIPLDLVVDGGAAITEFLVVPASGYSPGTSVPFSFATTIDLSAPGSHSLVVTATMPLDQNPADDTQSLSIVSGGAGRISSFPWIESFDALASGTTSAPLGWTQESTDSSGSNSDWIFRSGSAPTASTSPTGDHTTGTGLYAYVEDTAAELAAVSLLTPCIDLSGLTSPQLSFWFHSRDASGGTNSNPMSIDVIMEPGGILTLDFFGPEANIGSGWMLRNVDLSVFAGQVIRLRFRGRSDGGSASNDTAIDDVRVFEVIMSQGQPPVAGTALMDLNGAVDGNGAPVSSLNKGPFFATAMSAGPLNFSFEGEANRPFAFLFGPLNPVAATYPNVGQLDIGGAVNPGTGVPSQIQVLADGFNPVDFIDLLFNTGPSGTVSMNFQAPVLSPGLVGTFQTLFSTGNGFFFAISNAVQLTLI